LLLVTGGVKQRGDEQGLFINLKHSIILG